MKQIVSRGHTRPLTEISFVCDDPNTTLLISSAHDKCPQIRSGETGDWIGTFHGHKGAVWSSKVDSLTRTLACTGSGDFTAKLWCVTSGNELFEFKHKHVVKSVDFSMDTLNIATGCQDGLMRIYHTCTPEIPPDEYRVAIANAPNEGITKLLWSNEPNIIIVGKRNGVIEKWDSRSNNSNAAVQRTSLPCNGESVMDLEISEFSKRNELCLVAAGTKVFICSSRDLSVVKEISMPSPLTFKDEGGASLHREGNKIAVGGNDLWLREIDVSSGEVLKTYKGHHGPVRCIRYHPTGSYVASGSEDGTIRLWEL